MPFFSRAPRPRRHRSLPYCVPAPPGEDTGPWPLRLLPLTYFWWPALQTRAKTHSSSGAGHLPAGCGWMWGGGTGREARLAEPLTLVATEWPALWPTGSFAQRLPPPDRPEERLRGRQSPSPTCQQGQQVSLPSHGCRGGEEVGREASLHHLRARRRHPQRTGFAMREAHRASHTTSLVRGDSGYLQLGQHLHSGPHVHDLERPRRLAGWVGG